MATALWEGCLGSNPRVAVYEARKQTHLQSSAHSSVRSESCLQHGGGHSGAGAALETGFHGKLGGISWAAWCVKFSLRFLLASL